MSKYNVTEGPAALLGAVQSLNNAKDTILDALAGIYGEDQAQALFKAIPFDKVEDSLQRYLYLSITDNMGAKQGDCVSI